jgi:hypothetical protein
MGFSAGDVDRWEPWQLTAAYRGWRRANAPAKPRFPSDDQFRAAVSKLVH